MTIVYMLGYIFSVSLDMALIYMLRYMFLFSVDGGCRIKVKLYIFVLSG